MNSGRYILTQALDLVHWQTLFRLSARFHVDARVRHFRVRQQLICMDFAQLTWRDGLRDGLRDIVECLSAKPEALYHLGFREPVAKSTLADANERRDWRLWEALALSLIPKARSLYAGEDLGLDLENTIYALDSTTIDLSLTMFPWATFRSTKSGIKVHTQIDWRGPIPICVFVSRARMHDVKWLDMLAFESGAIYLFDKGYIDFGRLQRIAASGAFFVTRAKDNLRFARQESRAADKTTGLRSDQVGYLALPKAKENFPSPLRRIRFFDAEQKRFLVFLTNHMELPAMTVAKLYKKRWEIELFFKWIKGNLRIKHYYGTSLNAVKNSDLDRCDHISTGSHPAQGTEIARKPPQNSADFERSSVREDCFA
jgi:hypothetical protein